MRQPSKPIEQIISWHVYSREVGIDCFGMAADGGKVKAVFAFFNKVFHPVSVTVKLNELIWLHIHVCDYEGINVRHLVIGILYLENDALWIIPRTCLIHELIICYGITYLIFFGGAVQIFISVSGKGNQGVILL